MAVPFHGSPRCSRREHYIDKLMGLKAIGCRFGVWLGHGLTTRHKHLLPLDNQQGGVQEFLAPWPARRQLRIRLQGHHELVESIALGGEALLDGFDTELDGEIGFTHPGRTLDEQGFAGLEPGAGGEGLDPRALDRRLERNMMPLG